MQENVQKVETEFASGSRVGGFLALFLVAFLALGFGATWAFFIGLAILVSGANGTSAATAIETMIGALFVAGGAFTGAVLISLRKSLAKIVVWATLGVDFLFTAIVAITAMTTQITSYDYYGGGTTSQSLPGGAIVLLVGAIVVAAVRNGLIAAYFASSARVKSTLVQK